MTKEEILQAFSDINHAYNDCTKYDTLKHMLDELTEDCISREGVISQIEYVLSHPDSELRKGLEDTLRKAKTCISIQPMRTKGEWIRAWNLEKYQCDRCGEVPYPYQTDSLSDIDWKPDFCPNCGAKMLPTDLEKER